MNEVDDLGKLEYHQKQYNELIELVERCIDFKRWGFRQSYSHIVSEHYPSVVYDSEWCRVRFSHGGGDRYGRWREMGISYGRLHATNDGSYMIWNGTQCRCWHRVEYALNFLDGLSPQEVIKKEYQPSFIEEFNKSEVSKSNLSQPE